MNLRHPRARSAVGAQAWCGHTLSRMVIRDVGYAWSSPQKRIGFDDLGSAGQPLLSPITAMRAALRITCTLETDAV